MEENQEFVGNPYKKEDKKTLAEVIIAQIDVCRIELSKEMKPGFNQKIFFNGEWIIISQPDQRELIIACVKTLYSLMMNYFDKDFNEQYEKIIEKTDKTPKLFLEQYIKEEPREDLRKFAEGRKVIPVNPMSKLSEGIKQRQKNYYAEIHRDLFQELVLLFKRKNELSGKRLIGYK